MTQLAHLVGRRVLAVTGADRVGFLNGLVSNDVALAGPGRAVWAALLTPQGKYLADFFIFAEPDHLLLDCQADQADMISTRLSRFRLRASVTIAASPLLVLAAWDGVPSLPGGIVAPDPRLPAAGWRVLAAACPPTSAGFEAWDAHRLRLGLPDGTRDLEPEKTVLLEAGFDELNGISWTKGCYMGQELTARTRYRGLVKRRLLPVHDVEAGSSTALPPPGTPIWDGEREVGQMRSSFRSAGLAVVRLGDIGAKRLVADGRTIEIRIPDWAALPEPA